MESPKNVKCVVVGDGFTGKTSLLICYTTNTFQENYLPTVFDNFKTNVMCNGEPISLGLWDTSGQDNYDRLRPLSYPQTDVIVMCFAVNSRDSFENIKFKWVPEVRHHCPSVPIVLIATKIDLRTKEIRNGKRVCVSHAEGISMSKLIKAVKYVECSSRTFEGVNDVFGEAVKAALCPPCKNTGGFGTRCSVV